MTKDSLLVYVHGSGDQGYQSGDKLKRAYDRALFGRRGPSQVPTWWQVFWKRPGGPEAEAALDAVIERLARHPGAPEDDAAELLAAIRTARPPQPAEAAGEEALAAAGSGEGDAALAAIRSCYAAASSLAGETEMPDWIFRLLAGQAAKDVVPYLYLGWAGRMRAPVAARLRTLGKDRPLVVLAHSLGSVLAYDVVTDPAFADWNIRLFVTAGSPLGILNVRDKVRDRQGPGPFPEATAGWQNFYDGRDKVGWYGETLAGKYLPQPQLTQKLDVRNDAPNHHDLVGYLVDPDLQAAVRAALGL